MRWSGATCSNSRKKDSSHTHRLNSRLPRELGSGGCPLTLMVNVWPTRCTSFTRPYGILSSTTHWLLSERTSVRQLYTTPIPRYIALCVHHVVSSAHRYSTWQLNSIDLSIHQLIIFNGGHGTSSSSSNLLRSRCMTSRSFQFLPLFPVFSCSFGCYILSFHQVT